MRESPHSRDREDLIGDGTGAWREIESVGRGGTPLPPCAVEREDGLSAQDPGAVARAGRKIETVTGFQVVGGGADVDPEATFEDGIALVLRVLVFGEDGSFPVREDGHLIAIAFEQSDHPLLGQGSVGGVPTLETEIHQVSSLCFAA